MAARWAAAEGDGDQNGGLMSLAEHSFFEPRLAVAALATPGDGAAVTRIDPAQLLAVRPAH